MNRRILFAATLLPALAVAGAAEARTFTIETYPNRDTCYIVDHVPATVEVNTRGVLVQGESRSVSGSYFLDGGVVTVRDNPSVYIQTRRVVEEDHISLIPTGC